MFLTGEEKRGHEKKNQKRQQQATFYSHAIEDFIHVYIRRKGAGGLGEFKTVCRPKM